VDALYKCTNFGNCETADRQEIISSVATTDPKCPECDGALIPMKVGSSFLTKKKLYIALALSLLVLLPYYIYRLAFPPIAEIPIQSQPPQIKKENTKEDFGQTSPPLLNNEPHHSDLNDSEPSDKTIPNIHTGKEAMEMQERGIMYLQIAKQSKGKSKIEALKNGVATLNKSIEIEQENKRCFASGLMNRGMVNFLLDKPNKAVDDLKESLQCDPKHALSNMNLAIVYASQNKIDLSLDQIELAIKNGFHDCKVLRDDGDLKSLRNNPEYRDILERNQLFCLK
jgi:hypothetical protein